MYQHPYRWIIFTENDTIFKSLQALVDSDILIPQLRHDNNDADADDDGSGGGYNLKQFYKIDKDNSGEIYYEHYGSWSKKTGIIDERQVRVISRRRSNLRGKLITTSYVHMNKSSRAHLTDYVDKNIDSVLKANYFSVNTLLDIVNASKKELFQMTWGYYNARTKKWSGMVGDVVHKGADIGGK